jgi:hypothetical protein
MAHQTKTCLKCGGTFDEGNGDYLEQFFNIKDGWYCIDCQNALIDYCGNCHQAIEKNQVRSHQTKGCLCFNCGEELFVTSIECVEEIDECSGISEEEFDNWLNFLKHDFSVRFPNARISVTEGAPSAYSIFCEGYEYAKAGVNVKEIRNKLWNEWRENL